MGLFASHPILSDVFNRLFPSINIQILLICPKAFLTVLIGRYCSPLVMIFFILITFILG